MKFKIIVEDKEVQLMLQQYSRLPIILRQWLSEQVADRMRKSFRTNFEREGRPRWAPLSEKTIKERERMGFPGAHPILKRTGDLFSEVVEKSHSSHIELVRDRINYIELEMGGSSGKYRGHQFGKAKQPLPQRIMVAIQDEDIKWIEESLHRRIYELRRSNI